MRRVGNRPMTTSVRTRPKRYLLENERFLAPLLMSPAILYIIALVAFPLVLAIIYAFTDILSLIHI